MTLGCPACYTEEFTANVDTNDERKVQCEGCDARWDLEELIDEYLTITEVDRHTHREGYEVYNIEFDTGHSILACHNTNGAIDHLDEGEVEASFNDAPLSSMTQGRMRHMATTLIEGGHLDE